MNKRKCIIVDIDGTFMDISKRIAIKKPFITKEEDLDFYDLDTPKIQTTEVIHMFLEKGYDVIFCSGRTEIGRKKTNNQLLDNISYGWFSNNINLLMRVNGDQRSDDIIKSEMLAKIQETHDVFLVLDDRDRVVNYWRSVGLVCWQVSPGNF